MQTLLPFPQTNIMKYKIAFTVSILVMLLFPSGTSLNAQPSEPSQRKAKVKIAAVQISGYDKGDLPREDFDPVAPLLSYIERAGKEDADLVVFPEYVLGHILVPGPETERLSAAAAANGVYVIAGCWETMDEGTYANTALIFDRSGHLAGKYRKTHAAVDHFEGQPAWSRPPSGKDREWFLRNDPEWTMQRGEDLPVFDFDFGRVGILTCYDGWFPESFRTLSLKGSELIVWINGRRGEVEDFIIKSAMFQSHVALVSANQAYGGGTMIGTPPADILSRCNAGEEAFIISDVDLGSLRKKRRMSRNFQQRRPDLYGIITDVKPIEIDSMSNLPSKAVNNTQSRPDNKLRVATCQFPVSSDISSNARWVRQYMQLAKKQGAHLLHTSEASLSGYAGVDFESFEGFQWQLLRDETTVLCRLAKELDLWLVLGSAHFLDEGTKPTNCLYLIDPEGRILDRYDKSMCTLGDQRHYSAGNRLVTHEIQGVKLGLAICYDACWPQVYAAYQEKGTTLMLHSFYNARGRGENCLDVLAERQVPTRCADNRMWAVANNSSAPYSHWASFVARPDATIASQMERNKAGLLTHDFPDGLSERGWYHNEQPMRAREDERFTFGISTTHPRQLDGTSQP